MTENSAAWLTAKHRPLEVGPAAFPTPGPGEIVVRNHAVAINPVDWIKPYVGDLAFSFIRYPFVLGTDLAGEVAAVGDGVTRFRVGDRVVGVGAGACECRNRAAEGAFQAYTIVLERLAAPLPDAVAYAEACVLPLGVMTAACGLFQKDQLALDLPTPRAEPKDAWVIIWGGATSVGCNAVQLAVGAGYKVATTSSPKNFALMTQLGASATFDYNDPGVVRDISAALRGQSVVGALAIGSASCLQCLDILAACGGRAFVANCSADISFDKIGSGPKITPAAMMRLVAAQVRMGLAKRRRMRARGGIIRFFDASSVVENEIGSAIFAGYLGPALADARFRPAPAPRVVGRGLGAVQAGFEAQRAGVSAEKIVVELP